MCTNFKVLVTAEEDNKLKEKILEENQIAERIRETEHDQDEAKYSPEEKSVIEKSEIERTPTPSEESEEDEGKLNLLTTMYLTKYNYTFMTVCIEILKAS